MDVLAALGEGPLALAPEALAAAQRGDAPARSTGAMQQVGATAVIPVAGYIVPGTGGELAQAGAATGLDTIRGAVQTAAADPDIRSVMLMVDSPGGSPQGLYRATEAIRTAGAGKPVVAAVGGQALSAGYALAAAAGRVVLKSETSAVGSIGVIAAHMDFSRALDAAGVRITELARGARKTDGSPYRPLDDDARAELQAQVDRTYELFVADIGASRPATLGESGARASDARVVQGSDAVRDGFADALDLPEAILSTLNSEE